MSRVEEAPSPPCVDSEETQHKVHMDTILENELGKLGKFQLRTTVLCVIASIFSAWAAGEYLFTTARIRSRCLIPECDSSSPEFYPPWVYNAIPGSPGFLDNCQRFTRNSSQPSVDQTCPAELFDQDRVEDCKEYVYENTNTVVYDFGLACDEWRRTVIGSMRTVGTLFALPLTGYISDRWGRRIALTITGFNGAWLGVSRYFATTYTSFIVLQVIEATASSGIYTSAYILLIEVVGAKYRTAAAATIITFWAVGHMTLGLIAWGIPNWQNLTLVLFMPQFFTIAFFWIVTESARWYISKGKLEEAEAVLHKIAKINRKTLSLKSLEELRRSADEKRENQKLEKEPQSNEPCLIILVFRHKRIFLRCVVAPVWWITTILIYYGLSINAVNMSGNPYLNYVAVSAVEIPGFWAVVLFIDKLGRKPVLIASFWICAACQVAYIFIRNDYYGLSLTFYLLGKCSIAVVTSVLYIYTAELFPTKHRHTLFAFTSMMGRIGSIVAPLTPAIGASTFEEFPFVLFSSFALLSGILIFLTPETLGTKLPDTMEEAENLHRAEISPK